MMINERDGRHKHMLEVAQQMMTAARTAPKGKGLDLIEIVALTFEDIETLSREMYRMGEETGLKFMLRDSENVLQAEVLILIGTKEQKLGLNCAYCGFSTCDSKPDVIPCAINSIDVGIAVGSACATAADLRVDTRVMFSAGYAAERLNLMPECRQIIGIPVSAGSKNPFFDRKPKDEK